MKKEIKKVKEETSFALDLLNDESGVVSATECTGLMPTPPQNSDEAQSYSEIYVVPKVKNEYKKTKK